MDKIASLRGRQKKQVCGCEGEKLEQDICDTAVDTFVHRILLSATMNDKDSVTFGILDNGNDGNPITVDYKRKPKINADKVQERYEKMQNSKTNRKKDGRRNKWKKTDTCDDMPRGTVQSVQGKPHISVPLEVYRKMVEAEIDFKMKRVQDYYEYQSRRLEDSRLEALRETVYWIECSKKLEIDCSIAYQQLDKLNTAHEGTRKMLYRYEEMERQQQNLTVREEMVDKEHTEKTKPTNVGNNDIPADHGDVKQTSNKYP